jgi:propionyl-CoA carboxylase alpha chain
MRSLLVANRGEIAQRVFRTTRELGIGTVAVFSDADADLPFVREADVAVRLPGNDPGETYLRGDLIVDAARRAGADAVHPGYGFLSENAGFAQQVLDAGLTWVGPPPAAIASMGSKLEAKRLMRDAGVPTLPWSEDGSGAAAVGYPLLIKASAGGGGRGMRIVRDPDALAEAIESARREAAGAFGDATVFLERYVDAARHVEVQVMADGHGNVVSLFERECSIQRRHQKIVEEAPSPAVDASLRARMGEAAVAAAMAVGYVGAGTVEFVLTPDGSYWFLEMNTRLQVEHPVTEAITGLDLVRLQLTVAQGLPLPPEAMSPTMTGHAIEVRLYAEDAERGFLPSTGVLREFVIPLEGSAGLRLDSGVETGSVVSRHYDPMLAKVIAHAPTRSEAAARLASALQRSGIQGVTTNRDLLTRILGEPEFLAGSIDTAYLDRHDVPAMAASLLEPAGCRAHAVAAALAVQAAHRRAATVDAGLPSGWRNNPSQPQQVLLADNSATVSVEYRFDRTGQPVVWVDGEVIDVEVHPEAETGTVTLSVDGVRRSYRVGITGSIVDVSSPLGSSSYQLLDRLPSAGDTVTAGSLLAPMPGAVVRVLVGVGDQVAAQQPLVVLEAMKMEHTVTSPAAGSVVELNVAAGQQVDAGMVLAVVAAEDTDAEAPAAP